MRRHVVYHYIFWSANIKVQFFIYSSRRRRKCNIFLNTQEKWILTFRRLSLDTGSLCIYKRMSDGLKHNSKFYLACVGPWWSLLGILELNRTDQQTKLLKNHMRRSILSKMWDIQLQKHRKVQTHFLK